MSLLKSLLSINYIYWLLASSLFLAAGDFMSKKLAMNPKISYFILVMIFYPLCSLFWIPAIMQKNQLSIVGMIWTVLSIAITLFIGLLIFGEKLSLVGVIGVFFALIAVVLLSIA
jgi:multidrug transporter EmrE-like cation transporter